MARFCRKQTSSTHSLASIWPEEPFIFRSGEAGENRLIWYNESIAETFFYLLDSGRHKFSCVADYPGAGRDLPLGF